MAEKKAEQNVEKKAETPKQSNEQGKPSQGKSTKAKTSSAAKLKATAERATQKVKKVAERTNSGAAKVGRAAQELGEGIQEKIEKDIAPTAERARRAVSETTKKVREELGPAAEKAGKGLSAIFRSTARATRKSARILGIKASIGADMRKRQKLLANLGEKYYQGQKKKTPSKSDQDALNALVAEIKKVDAEIHTLEVKEKATRQST